MGCEVRRAPATVEVPFIPRPRLPLVGGIMRTRRGSSHALRLSSIARLAIWLYLSCQHHFISSIIGLQKEAEKMQEGSLNTLNHLFQAGQVLGAYRDCPGRGLDMPGCMSSCLPCLLSPRAAIQGQEQGDVARRLASAILECTGGKVVKETDNMVVCGA